VTWFHRCAGGDTAHAIFTYLVAGEQARITVARPFPAYARDRLREGLERGGGLEVA
jgi:hypothetical protein